MEINNGNIYLDIETGPDPDPDALEKLKQEVRPPGNYKKQESIQKWMDENAEAAAFDAWTKTSLDASKGYIASIGCALDENEPICMMSDNEKGLLIDLFRLIDAAAKTSNTHLTFVGHNISDFDLKFIWQRAMILKIKPPKIFPGFFGRNESYVFDTMQQWAGFRDRISQDDLCKALGIPGKPDTGPTGATIWEYLISGKPEDRQAVRDYNLDDVNKVRLIHYRMTFRPIPDKLWDGVKAA